MSRVDAHGGGGSGGALKIARASGNATVEYGQRLLVTCSADVVITAPLAAGSLNKRFAVEMETSNGFNFTLQRQGSDLLNGQTGLVFRQNRSGAEFQSDDVNWIGRPI